MTQKNRNIQLQAEPYIVKSHDIHIDADCADWIAGTKHRHLFSAKNIEKQAAVKVNEEMLRFYWELGRDIVSLKAESRWGSGFMKQLSKDLKDLNSEATCFSQTNLLYMKNFYCLYQSYAEITPQVEEQQGDTGQVIVLKDKKSRDRSLEHSAKQKMVQRPVP